MPLTYEETREYATLKGFNPDEVEVNGITGEIRPRNRIQPTMSTAKPADKPKTTGALETIAHQASLSAIPSAVSLPGSIAAGSAVTTALSPLFAGGPITGWIPPVAGVITGLGVGVASSMAASKLQEKALEQFQGGREYLEKSAALREERPYMSVVGDVAGSLPTMKVDGKVLKDAWHALTTEGAQQGPRMLANKLATSQAAQDVLISGGVGGVSSVVEDKLADKEVDIPKALLNTVLQGAVSTPREYVGRFPGLKNAPYRGQPLAEPSPAVLGVNEMTRTVRTKEAATGDEAVRVAKEIESLNSQIGELEKIRIESEAAKHTEVVTQAKIQLKELKARNEELNKILKGEEKTTTDFVASPESMEFTKAKAAQKGVEDTTFNEGGRQTVDSAEGYGSFSNDGTKIRVNTYAGTKGVKTNLPEGLQGVPTTGAHETVHAELYNVINSEISSQSRLGEQLRAAYENDPRFKEAKAKRPDANFDWNEYATIRAAQKFAKNPSNEGRSWSAERKALANVQKGKATADDADTVLLMKWRYDNGLNAPRGAVRANPNSTTPARNSLASNVEKEIKRVEEQPNTEQLDLPMAKEGTALTKWQRENVSDFEKPNFGPETRPAQNEFRFSKPEEENNKTFERAEAYAMARRRRNVENVEEGRQTSLDTATGATVDYVRTPEGLFVLSMDTPAESQGKGGATRLLNELRRKGPVILEANASEGEGLSQAQLTEFYTKRGLRNIGGNRFVGEPIVTPSVAAKTPVAAKPVEVKAPAEDATPIVSGQEQRVRTEGELKASTIEGQRAFVKKHPLLADFDENGKLKFFYEPKEWRSQELADWFGVTKRNINAYAERQGKSVREIDWNTVVNENQYKPINFPRREGVRGKAVRDEDTGRPLMRERPLNEKLDMDATVSGELSNKDTYLPAIEAGVRTALFPKENSGEMARRGRTRFAVTEGQNRWGSSIQTEAYVKRVTAEVYGAMAKEGLNVRGLDDKATFDDKIFKNAARIAERMLRDDVDVLKTRNINESASTDAPRGDGRTLGDTISTSQRLVPAGERASTEGDEDLIKAVADRIAEKKAELSSQTGIVRATEAMSNERIAAAWAKILDEYEFGRVDAADVMEAAVKVSTELKLRGVPDADIKRGVLDRMRDAGIGADDSVDAQATARYSRPEDVSADMMEAYRKATSSPDYIESERLSDEARELVTHRDGKSWPTDADHAKADVIRAQADALRSKYYDSADFKAYWKLYEEQRNAERSAELNKERSKIASNDSWDVAPPAKIKLSEDSPAEAVRAAQFKAPSHSTDIDSVESILSEGLRSGSALDTTPDRDWAGDGVSLIMPFARKGSKIEHNDYYKSSGVSAVGRIIVDAGAYNTPLYELESIVQGWKDKHPTVKMEIIDEKGRIIPIEKSSSDVRQSRPEGDDVDPIRTSTDQTKQGPLEKLAPQFDQVRKFDSKVADAFERAEKIKSLNEANYLNTPLVDFRKQFGGANERELKRAYDYALEKYRNPESVDETAFSEREKAMANFWNERISQPTREHQQRLNMFVETREGLRRKAKLSESYAPEMLNDKAIDVFTKSVDSSESTRMKREWAEHVVKMSASADKPVSMEDAMNEINDFVAAIGRNGAHSADFGALTKAAGYGLPEEMRERNLMRVMQRYGRRSSRLLAKVEGLQSDEYVRGKLRLENPETGKRAEPEDGNDILTHQEVRDAMKFIDGDFEINKSPRLLAAVRVVTNSILGPLSGVRDAASIAANSLPYMRVQDLPTLITSLGDMKSAWRKSLEYGARTGAHPLDAIATPLGTDNVVNAANVVSENLRKWSGRDAIEQFNRAWTYSIGKQLANQAVLSGNKAFLKKFGTLADVKGSDGKVKWDTDIMASNFVDRVQGTYGGRGLPAVAVDGMAAPWFALARWSLEKANVTWQDVIKPAYKGENYLPLLTYSLGTWLTGEAIESLNEALQAGKKSQNANWKEIEAADGGIEQEALRLANVMQLGSFLGMTGDMVKVGADLYKGNTPRGYSVPLADFISEGVIGNMTKFSRAVQDGANPIDALQSLMNDLAKSQWQAYRVGNYWANRDEVERTNKFRDLRVYKQTTGQEVPSEVPQANSAFRADEREFKRSTEPLDAAEKLRGVLDRFREEYKNDPAAMAKALRRLKSNSYQTFPSPQRDITDARKYYAYLTKAYGAEEADARVQDYLRQTKLNSLKSAAIPTLSR